MTREEWKSHKIKKTIAYKINNRLIPLSSIESLGNVLLTLDSDNKHIAIIHFSIYLKSGEVFKISETFVTKFEEEVKKGIFFNSTVKIYKKHQWYYDNRNEYPDIKDIQNSHKELNKSFLKHLRIEARRP